MKRERIETYRRLFAPVLNDIYSYFEIETVWGRSNEIKYFVDTRDTLKSIKDHIHKNIEHAPMTLVNQFRETESYKYRSDESGFIAEIRDIELLYRILYEIYLINRNLDLFDEEGNKELIKHLVLFKLWIALSILKQEKPKHVTTVLQKNFYFDESCYSITIVNMIQTILNRSSFEDKNVQLLQLIKDELITSNYEEIDTDFNFIEFGPVTWALHPRELEIDIISYSYSEQVELRENILVHLYFQYINGGELESNLNVTREEHEGNNTWFLTHQYLLNEELISIHFHDDRLFRSITSKGFNFVEKTLKT